MAFAALLTLFLSTVAGFGAPVFEKQSLTFQTSAGPKTITVEVADTPHKRQVGLMFRRSLGDDEGMIFLHDQSGPVGMWMKNTYISLDMIFVRSDGVIHRIEERTEPFSLNTIESSGDVTAVIEIIAGSARRLGLSPGDKVDYPAFE